MDRMGGKATRTLTERTDTMTEQTTAAVETAETTEVPAVETTQNEAILALVAKATEAYNAANEIAKRVAKSQGSVAKDIKDARENSDDETVVKFREWLELALAKINEETEKVNKHIVDSGIVAGVETMSDEEVTAAKAEHKTHKDEGNEAWNAAETVAKILGETMPAKPEVLNLSGKASKGGQGTGTGGRRLRFAKVTVNGEEVKNLAAVAQKIKAKTKENVTATDLQKALFETVGTDDMSKINDTTFGWTSTDAEKVTHTFEIVVYPKHDDDVDNGHTAEPEASAE